MRKFLRKAVDFFVGFSLKKYIATVLIWCAVLVPVAVFVKDSWMDIAGVVIGVVTTSVGLNFLGAVFVFFEDSRKVSNDDGMLKELYKNNYNETLSLDTKAEARQNEKKQRKSGKKQAKPGISFLYDRCYTHQESNRVVIQDEPDEQFCLPSLIENSFLDIFKAHHGSYYKNEPTVRLDSFDLPTEENPKLVLRTSRSNFFNHLVTNRAPDFKLQKFMTLRQIYEPGPRLSPLEKSVFSNHIGINALVFLRGGHLIVPHRHGSSTISKNKITSSVATRFVIDEDTKDLKFSAFDVNIRNHLAEKLYLTEACQTCGVTIKFLGFGRDVYEGGKPQFYFAVNIDMEREVYWEMIEREKRKAKKKVPVKKKDQEQDEKETEEKEKEKIDALKRVYISDFETLCFQGDKIRFEAFCGKKRAKKHCIRPEKSMLCNLLHYRDRLENG